MNGPGGPSLDWSAVLSRAHRRIAVRLAVTAAVGALGAALLLGGGTATRASIEKNNGPSTNEERTITDPPPPGEPNLVIVAEAIVEEAEEGTEGSEDGGQGEFTVTNESSVDASGFNVVATANSTGIAQVIPVPALTAEESASGGFECPEGDSVVVEIESSQPHTEGLEVPCAEGSSEDPDTTETPTEPTEPNEPTEPTEPTNPSEATKSSEEE